MQEANREHVGKPLGGVYPPTQTGYHDVLKVTMYGLLLWLLLFKRKH